MIDTIKNTKGYIIAYIEWNVVDKDGQFKNNGEYVYIANVWVHSKYEYKGLIGELSNKIYKHDYSQQAKYVYWQIVRDINGVKIIDEQERSFKSKRMSKLFEKEYILNKVTGGKNA